MGKISEILTSVPSPETDVILGSALYFNGEWDQYFIDYATTRFVTRKILYRMVTSGLQYKILILEGQTNAKACCRHTPASIALFVNPFVATI